MPLLYLGWGQRDFAKDPLVLHHDLGTNYYLVIKGEVRVTTQSSSRMVSGPVALVFDPDCAFSISQQCSSAVEILVWIWKDAPFLPEMRPARASCLVLDLRADSVPGLIALHTRCRDEVALADSHLPRSLGALHELLDVEIRRATDLATAETGMRWKLACAWISGNLSIHAPVPALCDYLRMSPSTLHRLFRGRTGLSPGAYFRRMKAEEARRLIQEEGWQLKAAAHHLGYRHANDLSRALSGRGGKKKTDC